MILDDFLSRFASVEEGRDGFLLTCPAHADHSPSLRLAAGERAVLLKCRAGCETSAVLNAVGLSFGDLPSVEEIAARVGRRATSTDAPADTASQAALQAALDRYAAAGRESNPAAWDYARDRFGIDGAAFMRLGLGLADDLGGGPRLVVPFRDASGIARGFQARALDADARVRWLGPKSPESGSWSKIGLFPAETGWGEILVCEGPGDALTACAAGYDSIGVRGASLATNPTVIAEIAAYAGSRPVVVVGDADGSGDRFSRDLVAGLARAGVSVRAIRPPEDGWDLTKWREERSDFVTELVEAVRGGVALDPLEARLDAWPSTALTELEQAKRLRDRIENADSGVHFTPETGFLLLDRGVWVQDALDLVRTFAQEAAADVWSEAKALRDMAEERATMAEIRLASPLLPAAERPAVEAALMEARGMAKRAKEVYGFGKAANSSRVIDATIRELRALRGVAVSYADFDRHAHLLAFRNGVVNLRTGELLPHDPDLLLTRRIGIEFDPEAEAPRWERFLSEVFPDRPDLPDYLRRLVGYGITGETSEQCFAVLYGTGANGKSVFTDTLTEVFREITTTTPFSTFEVRPSGGIPNDLAALKGARLVMASEGEQGRPMAEAVLKRVTGHDLISARFMRQEFFEFRPTFLLMLASNYKPSFRGQDEGLWRRVKLLPWERYFRPEERDHRLGEALLRERAGIVAWAVRGAREWYRGGLQDPQIVQAETRQYRETSDALAGFLPGLFVYEEGAVTLQDVLWKAYQSWADEEALPLKERPTRKAFAGWLEERGLERRKRNTGVVFVGVRRAHPTDNVPDHDEPEEESSRVEAGVLAHVPDVTNSITSGADLDDVF